MNTLYTLSTCRAFSRITAPQNNEEFAPPNFWGEGLMERATL